MVLDLSSTCLKSVLVHWAETYDALDVICDDSKPLEAISHSFDPFIGQTEKISFAFQGEPKRINFNLSHSIQFGNSKHYARACSWQILQHHRLPTRCKNALKARASNGLRELSPANA